MTDKMPDDFRRLYEVAAKLEPLRNSLKDFEHVLMTTDDAEEMRKLLRQDVADFILTQKRANSVTTLLIDTALHASPARAAETPSVPGWWQGMLYFVVPAGASEELAGDLEELFHLHAAERGTHYARWWYRWQVCLAAGSFLRRGIEAWASALSPFAK